MAADRLTFRLRLPCPAPVGNKAWGDFYFGRSLAEALGRKGYNVVLEFWEKPRWWRRVFSRAMPKREGIKADVDIIIRGRFRHQRRPAVPTFLWLISNSSSVDDGEIAAMDHVFVASGTFAGRLAERGHRNVSVLLQCTDAHLFSPDRATAGASSIYLFVGNRRDFERPSVAYALRAGLPLTVWGRRWKEVLPPSILAGEHLENRQLGAHYASAQAVLNDHTPDMLADGFTSNRVFDVLACGVPLVTDNAHDLPADLSAFVYRFDDYESFRANCAAAIGEDTQRRIARAALAETVRHEHSFDARAEAFVLKARQLLDERATEN